MTNNITIGKVSTSNPHLFLNLDTLDSDTREYVVATSANPSGNWISVNQFCSLMALYWLNNGTPETFTFSDYSKTDQTNAAETLIDYSNLESQVQYAVQNTGGSIKNLYEFTQLMSKKQKSKKIWFGSDWHVVAAVIDDSGSITLYDPNTGQSDSITDQKMLIQIASAMSANVFVISDLSSGSAENENSDDSMFIVIN